MIVTAALAWWNESPKDLYACVISLGNIADRLVAVDGAYSRYPGATVKSDAVQVAAIKRAAKAANIEVEVIRPERLWVGQVEKRTVLLQAAAKGSDWIVVVDADHIVHTDRVAARRALEQVPDGVLAVAVPFWTPVPKDHSLAEVAATNWHKDVAGRRIVQNQIIRSLPDYRVVNKHWVYRGTYKGREVEVLYGGPPSYVLPVEYEVEHRTLFRTEQQILDSRAFLNDRVMVVQLTGQEDDRPDLPPPHFDYETVAYPRSTPTAVAAPVPPKPAVRERDEPTSGGIPLRVPKPLPPWSKTKPNRVPIIGNAARGLEKGYPVAFRIRGEYRDFWPEPAEEGDLVIYRFRGHIELGTYMEPHGGRHRVMAKRGPVVVSTVYGRMRA